MRRKRKRVSPVSHDRWLVSYADFITLLFAFFVVMYSTAQVDKRKAGQLASAIQVAFQQLGAYPADPSRPPPAEQAAILILPNPRRQATDGLDDLRRELEQTLAPEISRDQVGIRAVRDGLVISLREGGFFDSGVAEVKASSQAALSRMAGVLEKSQYNLRIEGHTDNVRIHNARFKSNWELSTARSTEMIRLLIMQYDFAPQRLSASGYAEFHPIAGNDTASDRALNRRVDVVVLADHAPAPAVSDALVPAHP
jgi:chemotaxis protein MotB